MRNGIFELTREQLKLWSKLRNGYPTLKEKLDFLFFDSQPDYNVREVITQYFMTNPFPERSQKGVIKRRTNSERVFNGRYHVMVKYPRSRRCYEARIRTKGDVAIIEPVKSNRAFWLVNKNDLEGDVVDLNEIESIRQYHTKEGREILSDFR